jgi:hypothetical protein
MPDVVDDDTVQAVLALWATDREHLPTVFAEPPRWGRLRSLGQVPKASRTLPYAQVNCELLRRECAGTAGAWHDHRLVTLTLWGLKDQATEGLAFVKAVFNQRCVLVYPSTDAATGIPRFIRWWPDKGDALKLDKDVKDAEDVWMATLSADVWSIRLG